VSLRERFDVCASNFVEDPRPSRGLPASDRGKASKKFRSPPKGSRIAVKHCGKRPAVTPFRAGIPENKGLLYMSLALEPVRQAEACCAA